MLILISALTLALTGCSALHSSGLSCDKPSPPPDVTAPANDIAGSVRTLDGVREVRPIFSQQAPGPCPNASAYADEPWQSELQVTMIGTATAAQIEGATQLIAGRLPTSVIVPADGSRAKLILALPGGVTNAIPIGRAQAIANTPGMTGIRVEQAVGASGATISVEASVGRLAAVPAALSAAEHGDWLNGQLTIDDGPRFNASIQNGEPTIELVTAIAHLAMDHPSARVTSLDATEVRVITNNDRDTSAIATALASMPLSAAPPESMKFSVSSGVSGSTRTGFVATG